MLVRLNQTFHQHGLVSPILQELLHLRGKLLGSLTPDGVYTHCFREEDKVGICHLRV